MVSKTRMIDRVRAFDTDAVGAGLDESPNLLAWRDEWGRHWLHLCCAQPVENDAGRAEASIRTADALIARGFGVDDAAFTEGAWRATPLWFSVARGRNLRLAAHLLDRGATPAYSMHAAAFNDDLDAHAAPGRPRPSRRRIRRG